MRDNRLIYNISGLIEFWHSKRELFQISFLIFIKNYNQINKGNISEWTSQKILNHLLRYNPQTVALPLTTHPRRRKYIPFLTKNMKSLNKLVKDLLLRYFCVGHKWFLIRSLHLNWSKANLFISTVTASTKSLKRSKY